MGLNSLNGVHSLYVSRDKYSSSYLSVSLVTDLSRGFPPSLVFGLSAEVLILRQVQLDIRAYLVCFRDQRSPHPSFKLEQIDCSHVFPLDGVPYEGEYTIGMESDTRSPQPLKHNCQLTDPDEMRRT